MMMMGCVCGGVGREMSIKRIAATAKPHEANNTTSLPIGIYDKLKPRHAATEIDNKKQ
jgi:hypothetical protein